MKFIVSCFVTLFAFFMIYILIKRSNKNWIEIDAIIEDIAIIEHFDKTRDEPGKMDTYEVKIAYEYMYNDQKFTGNRIYPDIDCFFDNRYKAENFIEKYKEGNTIKVLLDENDPSKTCLFTYQLDAKQLKLMIIMILIGTCLINVVIYYIFKR